MVQWQMAKGVAVLMYVSDQKGPKQLEYVQPRAGHLSGRKVYLE